MIGADAPLLALPQSSRVASQSGSVVYVVDDEFFARDMICRALTCVGREIVAYDACEPFLQAFNPGRDEACLVLDLHFSGVSGIELLHRLRSENRSLPTVVVSGSSSIPVVVEAMKAGAIDFIEKPVRYKPLAASVERALAQSRAAKRTCDKHDLAVEHVSGLTPRQRQIMALIIAGHPNKNIASDLGINQRTVETHRASIMKRTGAGSLPALARMAVAASWIDPDDEPADPEPPPPA